MTRRAAGSAAALVLAVATPLGLWWPCGDGASDLLPARAAEAQVVAQWGRSEGLQAPRCVRVDATNGRVYVFGTDGDLHRFDTDGTPLGALSLPGQRSGNPQGLDVDADGNILVADTHAHCILRLRPDGSLVARYGKPGTGAGEFHWPTGVCEAPDRTLWVTEYGEQDRLHHLTADGAPIGVYGATGPEPGHFYRPSNVAVTPSGEVWVADACNHRLQVFSTDGAFLREVTGPAESPLRYPYDLVRNDADGAFTVTEYGAHRVRRMLVDGSFADVWGGPGTSAGQLANPWGCTPFDGGILVADTGNHRLQFMRAGTEVKVAKRRDRPEAGR